MAALDPQLLPAFLQELLWELVLVWYSVEYSLPIHREYPSSNTGGLVLKRQIHMEGMPMGSRSSHIRSSRSCLFLCSP
jgi:hypothetical protein